MTIELKAPCVLDAPFLHDPTLARLLRVLNHGGEHARIVGGAVRNALLGEKVHDIDIATTYEPQVVMRLVEGAGLKAVPTGIAFGTVTAVVEGRAFEITSLRRDIDTDGRRAVVAYGTDWVEDARRRDFTINALYLSADGRLHDPLDAYPDIIARKVRFIGDAAMRIREDYLRIWRFFRFSAAYGRGQLDRAGFDACISERAGLDSLSAERVRQELLKLVMARHAACVLTALSGAGILARKLGVVRLGAFAQLSHLDVELMQEPVAMQRLGVLCAWSVSDAARLQVALRLSHKERERLHEIGQWAQLLADAPSQRLARRIACEAGAGYRDIVMVAWALNHAPSEDGLWEELLALPQTDPVPLFMLGGADMAALGLKPGAGMGAALAAARAYWATQDYRPSKPELLDWLRSQQASQNI